MIEPTPVLLTKKCRFISFVIRVFLQFGIYPLTAAVWYLNGWFIALLTLILSFVIIGIVRAKLRNDSIPAQQREYNYNDQGIAAWYTAKHFCYEGEYKS